MCHAPRPTGRGAAGDGRERARGGGFFSLPSRHSHLRSALSHFPCPSARGLAPTRTHTHERDAHTHTLPSRPHAPPPTGVSGTGEEAVREGGRAPLPAPAGPRSRAVFFNNQCLLAHPTHTPSPSSHQAYQAPPGAGPRRSPLKMQARQGYGPTGRGVAVGAFGRGGGAASSRREMGGAGGGGRRRGGGQPCGVEDAHRATARGRYQASSHAGRGTGAVRGRRWCCCRETVRRRRARQVQQHAPARAGLARSLTLPSLPLPISPKAAPPPSPPASGGTARGRSPCARSASTSGPPSCSSASCPLRGW